MRADPRPRSDGPGSGLDLGECLDRVTRDVNLLVRQHVALARAEMKDEARRIGRSLGALAVAGALALTGWVVFCVGLGLLLGLAISPEVGLVVVGAINLVAAGALAYGAVRGLRSADAGMKATREEVDRDRLLVDRIRADLARPAPQGGLPPPGRELPAGGTT